MHFTPAFILAALSSLIYAVPQPVHRIGIPIPISKRYTFNRIDGSIDADALINHRAATLAKIQRGLSAYRNDTESDYSKRATGADPLTIVGGGQLWFGSISVGTPAETFTVDFDTGSSDLFLPAASCGSTCTGHKKYNPASSSQSIPLGKSFRLRFGDGSSVSGKQFTDTVGIAGLTATKQTLGAATTYSRGFAASQFPPDGLMGMGFPEISVFKAMPVFQTLVANGQTTAPVFAFKLAATGSELFLGGTNPALFTGTVTNVPVTQMGFWQVNMDGAEVAGTSVMPGVSSIIDTGTTLIIGDSTNVAKLYTAIGGSPSTVGPGFFNFPCASTTTVSLVFGGKSFTISPETFNLGPESSGSLDCVGGIVSDDTNTSDFWIIGDVFLANVYTSFDVGTSQVGFADLA